MTRIANDLRYGLRMVAKTPSATAMVLIAPSLGIGLSVMMFSLIELIEGAVLTPLPIASGDRVTRIQREDLSAQTADDYTAWSERQRSFAAARGVRVIADPHPRVVARARSAHRALPRRAPRDGDRRCELQLHVVQHPVFREWCDRAAAALLSFALFGLAPYGPIVFGTVFGVMIMAARLGCWMPARRATRVDPLKALAE